MNMWKGRFTQDTNEIVCRFTQSLDLDWRTAAADIRGSIGHARMLGKVGLLSQEEALQIERGLVRIAREAADGTFVPQESLEDIHMNVEARLTEQIGEVGAKLHMGRSRNDQANTTVRLALRGELLRLWDAFKPLLDILLHKAEEHAEKVVPGYTHLQQAQPISMGLFWMAYFQAFARDVKRLQNTYELVDECPLGAGALAGSTLPLDREFTARDLGFSAPCENAMDAVAHRDHIIDFHHFAATFGVHLSRLAEDLIVYFTSEFGWIKLPDAFCTGSSMMPQKKNPDVLEILRGKSGQLIGGLVDILTMVKGAPYTFNRDFQEDKRSLWRSVDTLFGMLEVIVPLLAEVDVNEDAARRGFSDGYIFATDVAEHLVQQGVPFRKSHEIVGRAVRWCIENKRSLTSLTKEEWKTLAPQASDELPSLLTPEQAVRRRDILGGAAPQQVRVQIDNGRKKVNVFSEIFEEYHACYPKMPE